MIFTFSFELWGFLSFGGESLNVRGESLTADFSCVEKSRVACFSRKIVRNYYGFTEVNTPLALEKVNVSEQFA